VPTPKQLLVRAAARNNAEWCAAMSRSHGFRMQFVSAQDPVCHLPVFDCACPITDGRDAVVGEAKKWVARLPGLVMEMLSSSVARPF
jgi:hypothetical protein